MPSRVMRAASIQGANWGSDTGYDAGACGR